MMDSKQRALDKLEQANHIFEPNEIKPVLQLGEIIIWAIEISLIAWLAYRLY